MSITTSVIESVIDAARSAMPGAVYTIRWGDGAEHEVTAFQPDGRQHDAQGSLDGTFPGIRGTLIIKLSDCSPWEPPNDDDKITVFNSSGVSVGEFSVLGHRDDPTNTIRRLQYGEASA